MAFSIEAYFRYEDAVGSLVEVEPDQKVVNLWNISANTAFAQP